MQMLPRPDLNRAMQDAPKQLMFVTFDGYNNVYADTTFTENILEWKWNKVLGVGQLLLGQRLKKEKLKTSEG